MMGNKKRLNVLAVGAHFDDIELGCGGTLVKHVKNKDNVAMLVVTHSGYMSYKGKLLRDKKTAFREGRKAAKILGIKKLICLEYETKNVKYCTKLIEDVNAIIDELKIDTVYTHWIHDIHQDHYAVAKATLNAARHIPRILMYRSNWYSTPQPFKGNFYVDISETINRKIKAIKAHKTEYKKFGQRWIDFIIHKNRSAGIEIETDYAEVFEVVRYLTDL